MAKINKVGIPPGTLQHFGERKVDYVDVSVMDYDELNVREQKVPDVESLIRYKNAKTVTWINVDGLHDQSVMETLGNIFEIHPLILEDIMHTEQRPKVDVHENFIYVVIKMLNYNEKDDVFESEQLSLVFGKNYVITFQEAPGDVFDIIREHIRKGYRIRQKGADFLAYSLIDLVVDTYFKTLERMGDWIEELEVEINKNPDNTVTLRINDLKHDLMFLRRNIWPIREVMNSLQRQEEELISRETNIFLKDVYDHAIQVIDNVEMYRDMISNLKDLYLSNLSFKMNEVMKTLTVVTTLFIPLTFITGIYGMNFEFMPELHTRYGYYFVLMSLILVGGGMLTFFKRKKWL